MSENIEEIIKRIAYYSSKFPRKELQFLLDNQAEATPLLLDAIRNPEELLKKVLEEEDYFLHFYAFYILAQFREAKAYPLLYDLFSADGETVDNALGDFVTEDLGAVLASVCGGDVSLINRLIENEEVNEYVRSASMNAWLYLVRAGIKSREEAVAYFKTLFEMSFGENQFLYGSLTNKCVELKAEELLPEIKQSFDEGFADAFIAGDWKYVKESMLKGKSNLSDPAYSHYNLIDDAIAKLKPWRPASELPEAPVFALPDLSEYQLVWDSGKGGTFKHETPKAGANDPCPCGSGRKYKKCCQNKK